MRRASSSRTLPRPLLGAAFWLWCTAAPALAQSGVPGQGTDRGTSPPPARGAVLAPPDVSRPGRAATSGGVALPPKRLEPPEAPRVATGYGPDEVVPAWRSDPGAWERWWFVRRGVVLGELGAVHEVDDGPRTVSEATPEDLQRKQREVRSDAAARLLSDLSSATDERCVREELLALGRLGEAAGPGAVQAITQRLSAEQRAVGEAAIVALGLSGSLDAAVSLASLVRDDALGRELVDSTGVPSRSRALACYALAYGARRSGRPELVRFAAHHLAWLFDEGSRNDDLEAACVLALGILPADSPALDAPALVDALLLRATEPSASRMLRGHAPVSLARLAAHDPASRERVARELLQWIAPRNRIEDEVRHGALLALGLLGDADGDDLDREIRNALAATLRKGERLDRRFAAVALADVGGRAGGDAIGDPHVATREVERLLTEELVRGKRSDRPWAALSLGWMGARMRQDGMLVDRSTADALAEAIGGARAPSESAAFGLAAGLIGDRRTREDVEDRFERCADVFPRTMLALALGLLGDPASNERLALETERSTFHVDELEWTGFARALLRDERLPEELLRRLADSGSGVEIEGCARALAWTGGISVAARLMERFGEEELPTAGRAALARAIGWILDATGAAWDAPLVPGLNYNLAPASLTSTDGSGFLDLL